MSNPIAPRGPKDQRILAGVVERLKDLNAQGYFIAIISNQGGIEGKQVTFENADLALRAVVEYLYEQGAFVHSQKPEWLKFYLQF